MFQTKICRENQNTHSVCSISSSQKSCRLWGNVGGGEEIYYTGGTLQMGVTAQAHFTLDTAAYKHALRICNTYCFSTAMPVELKCLTVGRTLPVFFFLIGFSGPRCEQYTQLTHIRQWDRNVYSFRFVAQKPVYTIFLSTYCDFPVRRYSLKGRFCNGV